MKIALIKILRRYASIYTMINIVFLLVCLFVQLRLNIAIPFLKVCIGALIISIFVTLSVTLFKMKKGNEILRIALGFIALAPIVLITKAVFGATVFRYSFIIYIFALLCAIIFCIAIIVVASRAKKEEKELNDLLVDKKDEE